MVQATKAPMLTYLAWFIILGNLMLMATVLYQTRSLLLFIVVMLLTGLALAMVFIPHTISYLILKYASHYTPASTGKRRKLPRGMPEYVLDSAPVRIVNGDMLVIGPRVEGDSGRRDMYSVEMRYNYTAVKMLRVIPGKPLHDIESDKDKVGVLNAMVGAVPQVDETEMVYFITLVTASPIIARIRRMLEKEVRKVTASIERKRAKGRADVMGERTQKTLITDLDRLAKLRVVEASIVVVVAAHAPDQDVAIIKAESLARRMKEHGLSGYGTLEELRGEAFLDTLAVLRFQPPKLALH